MRTAIVSFFVLLLSISNAQTGTYLADLEALKSTLQKMPSFKSQIKGEKLESFNALYDRLSADSVSDPNSYKYFYNLSQLFFPIRDNHLAFYQVFNNSIYRSQESIDSFVRSKAFSDYPHADINIDSLKVELAKRPADLVEGIYYYDTFYTVGLFRNAINEYTGVILDSRINLWKKGQIAMHLYQQDTNIYKAIYAHPRYKFFMLQPVEKYRNQSLVNAYFYGSYTQSVYSKQQGKTDYVNLSKSTLKFALTNISNDVQYLLIRTFQANEATSAASQKFYDSIQHLLKARFLILDLRNNEGGAEKEMRKYFQLLKDYVEMGNLYVLLNNGTLSQAEIFTLKLNELKNVTTVGETTKGMLAYGSNYGKRVRLPGGKFEVYPTDMYSGPPPLLQYEDIGIDPAVFLKNDSDWIEQTIELIRKNHHMP